MEPRQTLDFLNIQFQALIKVGLDIGATKGKDLIKYPWKLIYQAIITCYLLVCQFIYIVNTFKVAIHEATYALSMFNQSLLILLKAMVLIFKSDRMLKLIWDMNLLAKSANPREHDVWVSENRRASLISKVYASACWGSLVCCVLIPILIMGYQYFQSAEVELMMPFDGEYLFEDHGIQMFILNYILSLVYVYTLLNLAISMDPLFGWCVHAVSAHFRILRIKIEVAGSKIELNDNHADFLKDVGSIVWYHNRVLKFIDEINNIFGEVFWAEVMFSCLQMCFHTYSLNNDPNIKTMPFNVVAFASISVQMMIYCFGGEKLKTENNMLCDDIYMKLPWEKMLPSEKKAMMLPLMRSQRDTSLVGIFFELDRNLLVYIYRTAFSFNTLLGGMKD